MLKIESIEPPLIICQKIMSQNANEVVKNQIDQGAIGLEAVSESDVISFIGPLVPDSDNMVRAQVEKLWEVGQKTQKPREKLTFLLETGGGHVEPVRRIVDVLRHHYPIVNFVIPDYAFSAGTVLAMSGDAIFMDYYSVLGPIDPQIRQPDGSWATAIGYLKKYDELVDKSNKNELSTAELAFLLNKFDPMTLYSYEQESLLAISLIQEWLPKYKFKNWKVTRTSKKQVTPQMKIDRAMEIGSRLGDPDLWHSHGRGIPMQVLNGDQLNLIIDDMAQDAKFYQQVKDYFSLLRDFSVKMRHGLVVHTRLDHVGIEL
jgi:hypothetical protein